jgi:hypothetical protein
VATDAGTRSDLNGTTARLETLKSGRMLGRFFAATRARLREAATRPGVHHLA